MKTSANSSPITGPLCRPTGKPSSIAIDSSTPLTKWSASARLALRCFIALFAGPQDDHLFLQVKEARPSVLQGLVGPCPYSNNGERVVIGQRLMQSASDIFLGWTRGPGDRDFYVRQLHDMKISADLMAYPPRVLAAYGHICGRALARAHAKTGDSVMIAGYLGTNETMDDAVVKYAVAYADRVEQDFHEFQKAIRSGRFPLETTQSETAAAIR